MMDNKKATKTRGKSVPRAKQEEEQEPAEEEENESKQREKHEMVASGV